MFASRLYEVGETVFRNFPLFKVLAMVKKVRRRWNINRNFGKWQRNANNSKIIPTKKCTCIERRQTLLSRSPDDVTRKRSMKGETFDDVQIIKKIDGRTGEGS